ncbi:MAG: bifunctional nuclease family protein [Verrucomicrobiaceae bacterium]
MSDLVRVEPIALLPTQAGCAVFLGDGSKAIVFYIDPSIGASINAILAGAEPPRPLTHDLFTQTLDAFGAEVLHTTIVNVEGEVFYSRLFIKAENEIMERKIVELDARPSDCIAMAVRKGAPIFVASGVWEGLEDVSQTLEDLRSQSGVQGGYGIGDD